MQAMKTAIQVSSASTLSSYTEEFELRHALELSTVGGSIILSMFIVVFEYYALI